MPLLARMLTAPLSIDVRRGAIAHLGALLADRRISTEGRIAVAVGPGQGDRIVRELEIDAAEVFRIEGGTVDVALGLAKELRAGSYEAVAGIGGGRTIDVTKYAAAIAGIPMVAVATNLSHDGIGSPVSSLEYDGGKGSYGVTMPIAIVVDLDHVRSAPPRLVRSGVGDVVSNLSAIADWELAAATLEEPLDGLAVVLARTAAESLLYRTDSLESDAFLTVLAESLVLSGLAMSVAGSSRPCSGGDHEILHAVDQLFPGTANHGELAGVGALFCGFLRAQVLGDPAGGRVTEMADCLRRHSLPLVPADLGLSEAEFTSAVLHAPGTRPGRYTVLEHLDLDEGSAREQVSAYVQAVSG